MWLSEGLCITLLMCANVFITFACDYNTETQRTVCSSFDDLKAAGSRPEWKKLAVVRLPGNNIYTPVKRDTFINVPNVDDLQIRGLASKLEAGVFNGLNKIFELHLDDNKLGVVSEEPFTDIPVKLIFMFNCGVTDIRRNTFKNLLSLTKIDIQGNSIPIIEEGIFTNLKIIDLILMRNKIKVVKPNSFGNMVNLVWLNLEDNELAAFDTSYVMGYTPTLKQLFINRNKLTRATKEMFSVVPNLVTLLIDLNQIQRFGDYAFYDLKKMTLLDISNNHLEEIQSNVFNADGTSELRILLTHNNNLTFFSTGILARLQALKYIAAGGNPWQCPCWNLVNDYMKHRGINHICYEMYTQGSRPFCVISELYKHDCIYDVESVKGVVKDYYSTLSDYPSLPPVCYFYGTDVPFLGP